MFLQALLNGAEVPLEGAKLTPVLSQAMGCYKFTALGCHCCSQALQEFLGGNVRAWRLDVGWATWRRHLFSAFVVPLWSQTAAVDSMKGQHRQIVERGERRSTEAASTLPALMQQDEAEASSLCRFPHPAVRSQILEDIAPLMTWCHVIIVFGIWIPEYRSEAQHTKGCFCLCAREYSEWWREHMGSPGPLHLDISPWQKEFITYCQPSKWGWAPANSTWQGTAWKT